MRGTAFGNASVFAQNLRTNGIAGEHTDESGKYDFALRAAVGDRIRVWQVVGTEMSEGIYLDVPETDDGIPGFGGSTPEDAE